MRTINFAKKVFSFGNFVEDLDDMAQKTLEFYMNNFTIKNKQKFTEENR